MKLTLVAAVSILSTLASGLALPDLTRRRTVIRPVIAIMVKSEFSNTPFQTQIPEVSISKEGQIVETLLGFVVPACTGKCTISFDAIAAEGSRTLQLFTTGWYPTALDTWNVRPYKDIHKGTILVSTTGADLDTVSEDFGLAFDCPSTTTSYGFDVVPVGGYDYVIWDITKGGFIITCS